ncbi:hypothetical protein AB0M44_22815 [Streptosporangium subroseum]|uniref:hypothetical protein n=1 Tax=Streptosporangium subroseum TaxID=106412 RepID=UPI00342CEB08
MTMEAVRRVCGHGVDQITSLVDRSLVTLSPEKRESPPEKREGGGSSETREGGGVRYRLLETLRQYAAEKLEAAGEADRVRAEHALHFVELLEAAGPSLRTGDQLRELAMIDAEQGNLDAALDHAISSGDGDLALRMIMARLWPWVMRGRHREAGKWAAAVLEAVGDEAPRGREMAHALCVLIAPAEPYPARTRVVPPELLRALRTLREADHPAALGSWAIAGGYVGVTDDVLEQSSAMTEMFAGHPDPWTRATRCSAKRGSSCEGRPWPPPS